MIELKAGVEMDGVQPELVLGFMIASGVWADFGQRLVITAIKNGKHSKTSLHHSGNAGDLRSRYFDLPTKAKVAKELRTRLGKHFDVVVHSTHIHIEYQPRRRSN